MLQKNADDKEVRASKKIGSQQEEGKACDKPL